MDNSIASIARHDIQLSILKEFAAAAQPIAKYNFLGRPYQPGSFERSLGVEFSPEERQIARRALEDLIAGGFLQPTMSDMVAPDDWLEITPKGREALKRKALDALDDALLKIDPHLIEIRRGAWAALNSKHPDALRQAAHSGRELIDQFLKSGAPDDLIKAQMGFVADKSSSSGITRRMRVRYLMQAYRGRVSETDVVVAERAADLVESIDTKLKTQAHSRSMPGFQDVHDALTAAEIALRHIIVSET